MSNGPDIRDLELYADTDRQRLYIATVKRLNNVTETAAEFGITVRSLHSTLSRLRNIRDAVEVGAVPADAKYVLPGQKVIGMSTMVKTDEGNPQWIKTKEDLESQSEVLRALVDELCSEIKPRRRTPIGKKVTNKDLLVGYPIGDHHFGLYAYAAQSGRDYDLKIAKTVLEDAVDYLVGAAPPAENALLVNLGDWLHVDNHTNKTARGGHLLDVDTRYENVARTAAFSLAYSVERMLEKHKKIKIINVIGNHDISSSGWLSTVLYAWFRNEPRVEIEMSPAQYLFHQFGQNMICATHGDKVKLPDMAQIMASLNPEMWGNTKYRVAWTGHVHHSQKMFSKENRGAIAESFGTLPPSDAYAASLGYHAQREMHAIAFHRDGGVRSRITFNADLCS